MGHLPDIRPATATASTSAFDFSRSARSAATHIDGPGAGTSSLPACGTALVGAPPSVLMTSSPSTTRSVPVARMAAEPIARHPASTGRPLSRDAAKRPVSPFAGSGSTAFSRGAFGEQQDLRRQRPPLRPSPASAREARDSKGDGVDSVNLGDLPKYSVSTLQVSKATGSLGLGANLRIRPGRSHTEALVSPIHLVRPAGDTRATGSAAPAPAAPHEEGVDHDQSAEHKEPLLREDIMPLLKGVLLEKCGSLDKAFRWLNDTSSGAISRMQWESGIMMLKLPPQLKEMGPGKLFNIVRTGKASQINFSMWKLFFDYDEDVHDQDDSATVHVSRPMRHRKMPMLKRSATQDETCSKQLLKQRSGPRDVPDLEFLLEEEEFDGHAMKGKLTAKPGAWQESDDLVNAESVHLTEEVQKSGLGGLQALAYLFCAKLGSLDETFRWLDYNHHHNFKRVQWDTGMQVLHLDVLGNTGLKPESIFHMMDPDNRGMVTKSSWDKLWKECLDESILHKLKELSGKTSLTQRAAAKLKERWRRPVGRSKLASYLAASPPSQREAQAGNPAAGREARTDAQGSKDCATGSNAANSSSPSHTSSGKALQTEGSHLDPAAAPPETDGSANGSRGGNTSNPATGAPRAAKRIAAPPALTDMDGVSANHDSPAKSLTQADERPNSPSALLRQSSLRPDHAGGSAQRQPSKSLSRPGSPNAVERRTTRTNTLTGMRNRTPRGEVQAPSQPEGESAEAFRGRITTELGRLGPDVNREYQGLRRADRIIVEDIARELGLWCASTSCGQSVVVIREGTAANDLRTKLEGCKPGQRRRLAGIPGTLRAFARCAAESMGLWTPASDTADEVDDDIEVWNLGGDTKDFRAAVTQMLEELAMGEVLDFPPALTEGQRTIVKEVAASMQLRCHTFGQGLSVGRLADFEAQIRAELSALTPGSSSSYTGTASGRRKRAAAAREGLSSLELHVVVKAASELERDLALSQKRTKAEDGTLVVTITKAMDKISPTSLRSAPDGEVELSLEDEFLDMDTGTIKQRVDDIFKVFASGKGSQGSVLRKTDLHELADKVYSKYSKQKGPKAKSLRNVMDLLEDQFDDTMELQADMCCSTTHGLTAEYFQVFLSKASHLFGWSIVSLLFVLLRSADE